MVEELKRKEKVWNSHFGKWEKQTCCGNVGWPNSVECPFGMCVNEFKVRVDGMLWFFLQQQSGAGAEEEGVNDLRVFAKGNYNAGPWNLF